MSTMLGTSSPCGDNLQGSSAELFLSLINALMAAKCPLGTSDMYPEDYGPKLANNEEFDFIVVGAGSAGSVVANKLTEIEDWTVLVIEAGGVPSANSDIPGLATTTQLTSEDWQYKTETSEDFGTCLKNNKSNWPRGKFLGGCSTMNAMIYTRGNKRDYDRWAEMGNVGWEWDSVLRNYKEIENLPPEILSNLTQFGRKGYLGLSTYKRGDPILQTIKDAARSLGYPTLPVEQPLQPLGYFETLLSIEDGVRANSAKDFLGKVRERKNLRVALNALVTKVLISTTATGVTVQIGNRSLDLFAKKEVIVSAGTVNSPQLLMLSGIGPKQHLESLGIDTLVDLPVGKNLQDHPLFFALMFKVASNAASPRTSTQDADELYDYFMHRKGRLSQTYFMNLLGFINTRNDSIYQNVEIVTVFYDTATALLAEQMRTFGCTDEIAREHYEANRNNPIMGMYLVAVNPMSRGQILLRSKDPTAKPLIYAQYYTDEKGEDLETVLEAIRFVEQLVATEEFRKHEPELVRFDIPICDGIVFGSDDYWRCVIRQMTSTIYHPVGTCSMGPENDGKAVVDPRLRVYGVKNLRVVDASVMPTITSAHTNAPAMMIGHKAGEMIIEDWLANNTVDMDNLTSIT